MHRVDVVAQPQARVGDASARRRRASRAIARGRGGRRGARRAPRGQQRRRPARSRAVEPRRDERVVVVAGDEHDLAVAPSAAPSASSSGPRRGERLARRAVAQLERVAEQHEPVDAVEACSSSGVARPRGGAGRRPPVRAPRCRSEMTSVRTATRAGYAAARRCPRALDGMLVADFSRVLAGPLCTMTLGDLGADVIKVERPDGGDDTRAWGPPFARARARPTTSGSTATSARSRSTSATPATSSWPASWRARADVWSSRSGPGLMARWGLDYDDVARRQPAASSTARSPRSARASAARALPGYDLLLQAMGGLMTRHRRARRAAAEGRRRAHRHDLRAATPRTASWPRCTRASAAGAGQHVEVSLMDSRARGAAQPGLGATSTAGVVPGRLGNRHPSHRAVRDVPRRRRPSSRSPSATTRMFARLCEALGRPELAADERFADERARGSSTATRSAPSSRRASHARRAAEWVARAARGGRARRADQRHRRGVRVRRGARPRAGRSRSTACGRVRSPLRARRPRPPAARRRPPRLGEHDDEIRAWLAGD